jgi:hypothetical protein
MTTTSKSKFLAVVLDAWQRREKILRGHVAAMEKSGDCGMHFPDSFHQAEIDLLDAEQAAKRGGCSDRDIAETKVTAAMEF